MKLLERILVPTDFSSAAQDAVQTATFVAKQFASEICLLHVMPGTVDFCSDVHGVSRQRFNECLQESAKRMRLEGIRGVDTVVKSGVAFDQIDNQATERDVNVIIMGAGERVDGGLFRVGTTAVEVRGKAAKPVWVVKPGTSPQCNTILCPVDCSESSGRALENAIHLSRRIAAELTVLTVVHGLPDYYERFGAVVTKAEQPSAQEQLPRFEHFLTDFDFYGVRWKKVIRYGEPFREILAVVRERRSDLLVMGSAGRTGLSRILMGSVARKVAQEMPCSMITMKSEPAIQLRLDAEIADINAYLQQGHELLENGFPEEAVSQFQHCIAKDLMYAPAWEGLAAAHRRLNHEEEANKCQKKARSIVQHLGCLVSPVRHQRRQRHRQRHLPPAGRTQGGGLNSLKGRRSAITCIPRCPLWDGIRCPHLDARAVGMC